MREPERVLTGFQPSGTLTLGNYLGALKNCEIMQHEYDCFFMIADLHALTIRREPSELRESIYTTAALYLAAGLDPRKCVIFMQSQVEAHTLLSWVLSCCTQFGELSRMTQFKDKSRSHTDNINAGLFTYPDLMAADILLYNVDYVPIGEDQKQHLELTRNVAERFNHLYGEVFTLPKPFFGRSGARVMSLQDPTKKMSKSDANPNAYVSLIDNPEEIIHKFKRAVTDSGTEVVRGEGRHGINNLISIYSAITDKTPEETENEFIGKGYGEFKIAVAEAVIEALRPIREKYYRYIEDKGSLESIFRSGAEKASAEAGKTVSKVMRALGFVN